MTKQDPTMAETKADPVSHRLAERLRGELEGEVLFDRFSRGRYSTDASHYQIEPVGVVVPRSDDDVRAALAIAREEGVPVLPRGGGTSQSGQTVGRALVIDYSKHLNRLVAIDEISAHLRGRARHRARRAQPPAAGTPACGSRSTCRRRAAPPSAA